MESEDASGVAYNPTWAANRVCDDDYRASKGDPLQAQLADPKSAPAILPPAGRGRGRARPLVRDGSMCVGLARWNPRGGRGVERQSLPKCGGEGGKWGFRGIPVAGPAHGNILQYCVVPPPWSFFCAHGGPRQKQALSMNSRFCFGAFVGTVQATRATSRWFSHMRVPRSDQPAPSRLLPPGPLRDCATRRRRAQEESPSRDRDPCTDSDGGVGGSLQAEAPLTSEGTPR